MGTIVGSAVFNILIIIGLCALFAGQVRLQTEREREREKVKVLFKGILTHLHASTPEIYMIFILQVWLLTF